jgi:hypothetical protein
MRFARRICLSFITMTGTPRRRTELQPERIRTLELVLEQRIHRKFRISGSAYRYEVKDQITQTRIRQMTLLCFRTWGLFMRRAWNWN